MLGPSTSGLQLRAKQNAKHFYGVRERQFRRYVEEAQRSHHLSTGDRLLRILELRLDNVVYRLGFASTRAQARQFVSHGHVDVNGRRCTTPSRRLGAGDIVSIKGDSSARPAAHARLDAIAAGLQLPRADKPTRSGSAR